MSRKQHKTLKWSLSAASVVATSMLVVVLENLR